MPADHVLRPMIADDLPAAEQLTDVAYHDLDRRLHRSGWPAPQRRSAAESATWHERVQHFLRTDPGGSWVAEDGSGLVGVAVSARRDLTWVLATYAVRPGLQGRGIGRPLLEAAASHGSGCLRAMLNASEDPLALRRYRLAGFTLHPTMLLRGVVPRWALPVVERVRDGSLGDVDLMDSVDRRVRDAAHGPDHELLVRTHRVVVSESHLGSGYVYVTPGGSVQLLAATSRRTATDLLWEALAGSSPEEPVGIGRISAANEWAVDVGMACRMQLWTHNYLALRGMKPPSAYVHSGSFL